MKKGITERRAIAALVLVVAACSSGDGGPFGPDQRLDLDTALAAFTIGSAWVNRLEADTGTIEVGKLADLVVLDRDLRAIPDGRTADAKVVMTFVGGDVVFGG